jgi:hypothetical protein
MIRCMGAERRGWKFMLMRLVWVGFTALLALLAVADLVTSIIESNSPFVRDPGGLIVLAALTSVVCLAALVVAASSLSSRLLLRRGRPGGAALTFLAALMIVFYAFASLLSGPL